MKIRLGFNLALGLFLLFIIFVLIFCYLVLTPRQPNAMHTTDKFTAPGLRYLFGSDNFGRDIFSRVAAACVTTLQISIFTVAGGAFMGILLGSLSGYFGGLFDELIMRLCDSLTAFPGVLLALIFITVSGPGVFNLILALSVMFTPSFARLTRSGVMRLRESEYVHSARLAGAGRLRIIFVHILPNLLPELVSAVSVGFANAILSESALSFLGLGVQPPDPSLGGMLSEAQGYLFNAPWMAVFPGLAIVILVMGLNYLSDGVKNRSSARS